MSKSQIKIGFATTVETSPGIWDEQIQEKIYYADVTRRYVKQNYDTTINANVDISNTLSIVANPEILTNLQSIRYVSWMGQRWSIGSIEVNYPRLILGIGGIWNG